MKDRIYSPANRGRRIHFVYLLLDSAGEVLYVGRSMRPEVRWGNHLRGAASWVANVSRFRKIGPFGLDVAERVERELIEDADPIGNVMHTSRYVHWRRKAAA